MSNHKRKLTEIDDYIHDETDLSDHERQPLKKQKVDQEQESESMRIFNMSAIKHIILDHLPFDHDNYDLFMYVGDDHYFERSLLKLNKNDIAKIKANVDGFESETNLKYDIYKLCIFYANIKIVFGQQLCNDLLRLQPVLSRFKDETMWKRKFEDSRIDEASFKKLLIIEDNLDDDGNPDFVYFRRIALEFTSPFNISHLFEGEQKKLIERFHLLSEYNSFHIFLDILENRFVMRVCPLYPLYDSAMNSDVGIPDRDSPRDSTFSFICNPKPCIVGICIQTHLLSAPRFHTRHLLPSIRDVTFQHQSTEMEGDFKVEIDHDPNRYDLRYIRLRGTDERDSVFNINFVSKLAEHLSIYQSSCSVKLAALKDDKLSPGIADSELAFIRACKADDEYTPEFCNATIDSQVLAQEMVRFVYHGDFYYFRFIPGTGLRLAGCRITSFSQQRIHIATSEIPMHWEVLDIGNRRPDANHHVRLKMDSFFPPNLRIFCVKFMSVDFDASAVADMRFEDIPDSLKIFRLSVRKYDDIRTHFSFLTNNEKPTVFKKIRFLFQMDSSEAQKLKESINPAFETKLTNHVDESGVKSEVICIVVQKQKAWVLWNNFAWE